MIDLGTGPILAIAPHPDDETIGAGGSLLRAKAMGREIHWLIVTGITTAQGWPAEKVERRALEIERVAKAFDFDGVHRLDLPAARLDAVPQGDLVAALAKVVAEVSPETLLYPHRGDAHTDHEVVHDAASACAKRFRYPSVKWSLAYETLSETDASVRGVPPFVPNYFVDIADHLERKLEITAMFNDEIQDFPFPRSLRAIRSLADIRGVACGTRAAEAFMILRGVAA